MQQPQQRIRAGRHARLLRQPRTTFTTGLQRERLQQLGRAVGAAGVRCQRTIEPFGEDLPRTARQVAEPSPSVHAQAHHSTAPGKIERPPLVAAVAPPTQLTAAWTRNSASGWLGDQDETPIRLDDHEYDLPPV